VPPWSLELPKDAEVKVFVSDPGDEMEPIVKNKELCDNE
jgi:hypothetical protein